MQQSFSGIRHWSVIVKCGWLQQRSDRTKTSWQCPKACLAMCPTLGLSNSHRWLISTYPKTVLCLYWSTTDSAIVENYQATSSQEASWAPSILNGKGFLFLKNDSQHVSLDLWSGLLKTFWKSQKHGLEPCNLVPGSLCLWCHEQGWNVWQKGVLCHGPTFFCSSLVKSEPTWLLPEKPKVAAEKSFCYIKTEDVPLVEFMYLAFTRMPGGVTTGNSGLRYCVSCLLSAIISLCLLLNTDRTATPSLQMKVFAQFLCVQDNFCLC